jgi:hypothetical protein
LSLGEFIKPDEENLFDSQQNIFDNIVEAYTSYNKVELEDKDQLGEVKIPYTIVETFEILRHLKIYIESQENGTVEYIQVYNRHIRELQTWKIQQTTQRSIISFFGSN